MHKPFVVLIVALGVFLMSACSGCGNDAGSAVSRRPDKAVISVAQSDARGIMSASESPTDLERELLDARSKEQFMRERGLSATADLYVSTIEKCISDSMPDLAGDLLIGK